MFNWLKAKKFSIFMLQEVHCVKENIPMYLTKWGYQGFFSCYSKQVFVSFSSIILIYRSKRPSAIAGDALLHAISKSNK